MHGNRHLLALLALSGSAFAQSYFSGPPGYLTTEGASSTTAFTPFYDKSSRAQWVFGGLRNNVYPAIKRFEQRRDGTGAAGTYPARTLDLLVIMADADLAKISPVFANNYIGAPTVVYTKKPTNLPDHSVPPATAPAPWTVSVPYDSNYLYTGLKDLLLEVQVDNVNGNVSYSIDAVTDPLSATVSGTNTALNTAGRCTTANGAFNITGKAPVTSVGQTCTLQYYALRAPSSVPGILALGVTDPNISGVLCAPLRTSVDLTLPVTTDAAGNIGTSLNPIAISFPLLGAISIYAQFAAPDPTQVGIPVALSDAVRSGCVTNTSVSVPQSAYVYGYGTNGSASSAGTIYASYISITRFTY